MTNMNFDGPLLKVERAEHHIYHLEVLLGHYVADNRKRFRPKQQERAFKQGRSVKFAEPPRHTPTVLGDAIHNLRVALDHAYCILIEANGHTTTDYSSFPFGKDWPSIEGRINKEIEKGNGPSDPVRDFIGTDVQPFPGGPHNLWDLHRLDITDKHKRILPMGSSAFIGSMEVKNPSGWGPRIKLENISLVNCGGLVEGGIAVLRDEVNTAFDVNFGRGQPLEGQPILVTLRKLKESVCNALRGLSEFL